GTPSRHPPPSDEGAPSVPRRRRLLIPLTVTTVLALALTLVALSDRDDARAPTVSRTGPPPTAAMDTATLVLPFDAYENSPYESLTISEATDLLLRSCLRAQGVTWSPLPPLTARDVEPPHTRRYGLTGARDAARYGYHLAPPSPAYQRREAARTARGKLPAAQRRAAYGPGGITGVGGCWARANARIVREVGPRDQDHLAQASTRTFAEARRSPEVTAANRAWSACMKRAGFSYGDPFQSFADPAWGARPRPVARELATAAADVRCKEDVGLVEAWVAADRRVQEAAVRAEPARFRAHAGIKRAWLATAQRVLRTGR
ncbi:hypothetical protein ACFVIM_30575, partial [Streptomyces sp. NPDC057638]|uniref:hypothetical protein n=1 Tax=Streptomyces sp. NPDC057638 TaxID=3346190 RepID=UPI0036B74335